MRLWVLMCGEFDPVVGIYSSRPLADLDSR
jgi:hypothetical protein